MFLAPKTAVMFKALEGIIFPSHCPMCDEPHSLYRKGLCPSCSHQVIGLEKPQCRLCGAELPSFLPEKRCKECRRNHRSFSQGTALLKLNTFLKHLVRKAKYQKRFELWQGLLGRIQEWDLPIEKIDAVTSLPMTWRERFSRELNISESIARMLSARLQVPYVKTLQKTRHTKPQATLSKNERKNNLTGAFKKKPDVQIRGKHLLIADDILTTGTTLETAAQALLLEGAKKVSVAVLARSGHYENS
jgi:ComF family protein